MKHAVGKFGALLLATCLPLPASATTNGDPGVTMLIVDVAPEGTAPRVPHGPAPVDLAAMEPLSEDILSEQRGGFMFEGMDITFGAEIRTIINGELVLQTNLTVDNNVTFSQVVSPSLTAVDPGSLPNGILDTGAIHLMPSGSDQFFLTNDGQTALLQRVDGALQNILINTMNGLTGIQEIDATIGLSNSEGFRSAAVMDTAMSQIHSALTQSAGGGLGQ
jgi:hypothetical protein